MSYEYTGGSSPAIPPELLAPPELTTVQTGWAWFKLTFGTFFMVAGLGVLARFYYVRNVFEIRARSPYLIMVGGISLLGLVGLTTYLAAYALDPSYPLDVYKVFYSFYFFIFCFSVSFWLRILRLGLAYCPRYKRKFPWLMSERLLVCLSILAGAASISMPLHHKFTKDDGPLAWVVFTADQQDQLFVCQVVLLIAAAVLFPVVWYIDDLFQISTELLVATVLQTIQTVGNGLVDKYGSEETLQWINDENVPFTAGIILFSIMVIEPLRKLAFNPMAKTYPSLARAQAHGKQRSLRVSKKGSLSEITDPDSQLESQDSHYASANELGTPTHCQWSYEDLAANPGMSAAFRAFAFRALCEESVVFLEEVSRYQNGEFAVCPPDNRTQKAAFSTIVVRFIADGSADEVNISWGDKKKIMELNRSDALTFDMLDEEQKRTVFDDAYVEIRRVLEANLLRRFTATQEFKDEEKKAVNATLHRRGHSSTSGSFGGGGGSGGGDRVDDEEFEGPQVVVADY